MKQKKVIVGFASLLLIVLVIGLNFNRRPAGDLAVGLTFVGYTNVNGNSMALFKVQNNQSRRIWLRHCYYLPGEAFREPAGAWQCSDQAASNRWDNSPMDLRQFLPPEPTRTSPDPNYLTLSVPTNQALWRIGVTVEFNIRLSERLRVAWKPRDWWMLKRGQFINNSTEAIWVESPVITNATILSGGAASSAPRPEEQLSQ